MPCQAQWRHDDLDKSEVQGAGKAWAFSDDVRCTERFDMSAKAPKRCSLWIKCKANRCGKHNFDIAPMRQLKDLRRRMAMIVPGVYDNLGDCCDSGRTDQCGVCDGDGSVQGEPLSVDIRDRIGDRRPG